MGVSTALIYAPGCYAKTDEIVALARIAASYGGLYISHIRSEGNRFLEGIDELLAIAAAAQVRSEIYHFKAVGEANWDKVSDAIARIENAQASGLKITADMYPYDAGSTGLNATMPPWVQEGGYEAWSARLRDPGVRSRVVAEMVAPTDDWENLLFLSGSADKVILCGFKNERLKPLTGRTLAAVASERGKSPEETAIDLVIEDGSGVQCVFSAMSEENIRSQLRLPWVSIGSDSGSVAAEGVFLKTQPHPRAYGTFARWLGHYARDEQLVTLPEAVRRMTALPADSLGLRRRGRLAPGSFADVVVFDPDTITDHATYDDPHRYATGVEHVLVNGVLVLRNGDHTDATPGRVVYGPGFTGIPSGLG